MAGLENEDKVEEERDNRPIKPGRMDHMEIGMARINWGWLWEKAAVQIKEFTKAIRGG